MRFAMAREAKLWCVLVVAALCAQAAEAGSRVPVVQVFTRHPVEVGQKNILQCYVDQFHPPKIDITLLKDGMPLESQRSDLSFHSNWAFHQLVYANVTFDGNTEFACKVNHETLPEPRTYKLDVEY